MHRNDFIDKRAARVKFRSGTRAELTNAHYRILEHQERGGITAGFELWWDEALIDLEAWGLMSGEWIGALGFQAHPFWSITIEGENCLRSRSEIHT